jgi:hypothetical protein
MKRLLPAIPIAFAFSAIALGQLLPQTPAPGKASSRAGLSTFTEGRQTQLVFDGVSFRQTPDQVTRARVIAVPQSTVRLACWEETSPSGQVTPYYAIFDGQKLLTVRPTSYVLKLRHGAFDPLAETITIEPDLAADAAGQIYFVQFVTQPLEQFRSAIEACGGTVYKFVANHAYIVKMAPDVREAVAALPFVRWVGPYHPAYRLEDFLRDNRRRADDLFPSQRYNILTFERSDAHKQAVVDRIEALGGTVDVCDAGRFLVQATLTPQQLYQVIRWDEVQYVDRWSPAEADMDKIRIDGGADYIESVAGYDGAGVRGEIIDIGFCLDHVDFASRPLIQHTPVTTFSHGCATSGIIFGDGTGDPRGRGLCPAGQGIVADWDSIGSRYDHTAELLLDPYYALFVTASLGGSLTSQYTTTSADMDDMLFDLDILHCNSMSNAGSQQARPEAWAKNIVGCGGIYHYDTLDTADDCWCGGASIGPAADGRVKPDLMYWYDAIYTLDHAPSGYADFCCTSGATPTVAGHFGLFFQMWSDGIFGNPVIPGGTVFENRPHMTTAKAALINTANQYPFSGAGVDLTRMHQGWGRPSVANLYDQRNKMFVIDETELLQNLDTYTCQVFVAAGEPAVKFTMTYADPAGVPGAAHARINDLTLKVVSPSGVEYWGNNGLLTGNWSQPGGAPDTINTVENVFVQDPEPGAWTAMVIASEINEDGHVETPEPDADFALVITGTVGFALNLRLLDPAPEYLAPGQPTAIVVAIDDGIETYVPGSATLHYSYDGGPFQEAALSPLSDNLYQATLPPATCSATPRFHLSAAGSGGTIVYSPLGAPEVTYAATVGVVVTAFDDDFEQDRGWTVWNDPSLTGGMWQRGIPLTSGVQGQPPTADYDGSGQCYLTQNIAGNSDVDGGPTRLTSPLLDLTDLADPVLQFARWWANDDQDGDPFDVEASSDDGATWVLMRRIQNVQPEWASETIHLLDFIPLSSQVRLRFSVRDVPNNSIDEGALDAVLISSFNCTDVIVRGDLNCDGLINAFDIDPFVLALTDAAAYGAAYPGCPLLNADCNGDGLVNAFDIDAFVVCLTTGCWSEG